VRSLGTRGIISIYILFYFLSITYAQDITDSLLDELALSNTKSEIYNQLAELILEDSVELSMYYANQALKYAIPENNIREEGISWFNIAEVHTNNYLLDSAVICYQNALTLLKQADDPYYISYTLNNLGWIYNSYGKYKKALECYIESIQYLDPEEHADDLAHLYINIGNTYHLIGSYHTAINYFHKARTMALQSDNQHALPILYNGLGLAYKYLSNFDSAIHYYNATVEIDKAQGTPYDQAIDYGNIGALYFEWKQYDQSFYFHKLALKIYQIHGKENDLSVAYNNLGEVFKATGQYDSSLYYLNKALEIDRETGMEQNMANRFNNLGDVYYDLKDYQKALNNYHESLHINRETNAQYSEAVNLKNIALISLKTGNHANAERLFKESLEMAQKIGAQTLEKNILENMVQLYSELGQYEVALKHHFELDNLNDSLFRVHSQQMLADFQTRYELDQKQNEIALLNRENDMHVKEVIQYRSSSIFFGSALFIICILMVILIVQYNLRKRAYKKLFQKNMELVKSEKMARENGSNGNINDSAIADVKAVNGNHKVLYEQIKYSLKKEKPYLKHDLTIKDWASQLQTNTHYLSEVINQKFGNNFTGLINEYRVKEACRLLSEEEFDQYTIETIAREAGFNSKSAFNNAFKTITGLTPSYYKNTVRKN
jgi:tetratricopeptide (TPR) repeat protein